jgi:hypothetical protein
MKTSAPSVAAALSLLAAALALPGCKSAAGSKLVALFPDLVHTRSAHSEGAALFAELGGEEAFLDLARYLYRWYLDEHDFQRFASEHRDELWIRRVQVVADANDGSRYLEVVFPATGVMVTLKKTDYRIPELKLHVKSDGYRVIKLCRDTCRQAARPADYAVLDLALDALYRRLFELRLETRFPREELQAHVQADIGRQGDLLAGTLRGTLKTLYFAPVHAVDNELWVFWEEGKLLFRYSSDIDLSNPDVWTHDRLDATVYDTVAQTVVSFEERPGDNRFVTRDQVGRALYNCVVLGQKRVAP